MSLIKVLLMLALILLALVFVIQNAQPVEVNFIGLVGLQMPLAFLVVILLLVGVAIGWLLAAMQNRRLRKAKG